MEKGIIKKREFPYDDLEKNITRQEMALIAVRVARAQGQKMPDAVRSDIVSDYSDIDLYYQDYVLVAFSMGLLSGYDESGTFGPKDTLTREQGAMVAYRLVTAEGKGEVDNENPVGGMTIALPDGSSKFIPLNVDENGVQTIYDGVPSSRPAKAGDIFVKDCGIRIKLETGPNGIVGEGQGVAPDKNITGLSTRWTKSNGLDVFVFDSEIEGDLTDSLGVTLHRQSYGVNRTTGEGHWFNEWRALRKIYKAPKEKGTYYGQVSTDPYKLYVWDDIVGWVSNYR